MIASYEYLGERPGTPDTLIGSLWGVGSERGTIVGLARMRGVTELLGPMAKVEFEDAAVAPKTIFPRPSDESILHTWGDFS